MQDDLDQRAADYVTVGVVGAGRRMTPLLSRMLEYDYVDVRIVIDSNAFAPGMLIAQSLGVKTSDDLADLFRELPNLDFVFCVHDDEEVKDAIMAEFVRTSNRRTMFLNELATRFIMSLCKDARELMQLAPPRADSGSGDLPEPPLY
ncbi:MAG: hypothetical protein Kow00129_04680 [Thermoleophilia bacterium]